MFRIAHISDLHLVDPKVSTEVTALQRVAGWLQQSAGLDVNARPFSQQRLDALSLALRRTRPSLLMVTGDLTNFGDDASLVLAKDVIDRLRDAAGASQVIVIPGNHDTLAERAAAIDGDRSLAGAAVRWLKNVRPEIDAAQRLGKHFAPGAATTNMAFLNAYAQHFGDADPSRPEIVKLPWGKLAVFRFNSNLEHKFMANAGCIGSSGYLALGKGLLEQGGELDGAIKVAVLHHHPISAPQALDPAVDRFFNWMEDGPLFLQFLNLNGFSLILHGHQHEPFVCSVDYGGADDVPLHIIAAGSAIQAVGDSSFNVIDLLNPFQVRVERHEYSATGFAPVEQWTRRLPIRSLAGLRLTPRDQPEIPEDGAVRNLVMASEEAYDVDCEYDLLNYEVKITADQRYVADYRRVGRVVTANQPRGPIFVVTGSPAMKREDMKLRATLGSGEEVDVVPVTDYPTRKVLRVVVNPTGLKEGEPFDVTLHFEWQASKEEPNDFDGFNLLQMRHGVKHFTYKASYPWKAKDVLVREFLLAKRNAARAQSKQEKCDDGCWMLTVDLPAPEPTVYLMFFGSEVRHEAWDC